MIKESQDIHQYTYPDVLEIPVGKVFEEYDGTLSVKVEDENARFNINSLIFQNGMLNQEAYRSLKRLLKGLNQDEAIADRIADWIDKDAEPRAGDSEEGAKNGYLDSVDELLLIRGISRESFDRLAPYLTVYGINRQDMYMVNINTASLRVLMAMDERMTEDLAKRIVQYRSLNRFEKISDLMKVSGFEGPLGQSLMSKIAVRSSNMRITAVAEAKGIKRIIECVVEVSGSGYTTSYWREM
jgi:general secretion pathway protein K